MQPSIGLMVADGWGGRSHERRLELGRTVVEAGLDHLAVGDHVSFFVGLGADGLAQSASLLSLTPLPVHVGVYLLPLRHPVVVARQLATIHELAPGRLRLGVGIGGEDPHEVEMCGIDPRTRGRRMDECLEIVRALMTGEQCSFDGEFFTFTDAQILPAVDPRTPLVVGGRSDAAVRRAGRLGDGWIGIWVSARRFGEVVDQVASIADDAGRGPVEWRHAMNVWCGIGESREEARGYVAPAMQAFYQVPFESFEKWSPYGTPSDVAEAVAPYLEAGCTDVNLIACGADEDAAIAGAAAVRHELVPA